MNHSAKKEQSDSKAGRLKTSDLEKPREASSGLKDQQKFWLIENAHLNNIIEEQQLQLGQLRKELAAVQLDSKALEGLRRNNEQLQLEMQSSQQKMLQLVDQNRELSGRLKKAIERCKELEGKAAEASQLKLEKEQVKYEYEMKLTALMAELEDLRRRQKKPTEERVARAEQKTPIKGLIVRRHRIATEANQTQQKQLNSHRGQQKELIDELIRDKEKLMQEVVHLQQREKILKSQYQGELEQQALQLSQLQSDKADLIAQVAQLQGQLEKMLGLNSQLQHQLRVDVLQMKLLQTSTEPQWQVDNRPVGNQQRANYEQKLQSKKALIQLLNRKISNLEKELTSMCLQYETLQEQLVKRCS